MTGPEHYREAERLTTAAKGYDVVFATLALNEAQVHATLAQAAATALANGADGMTALDGRAWDAVCGAQL